MQDEKIKTLICKHLDQGLTAAERGELEDLVRLYPALKQLLGRLESEEKLEADMRQWARADVGAGLRRFRDRIHREEAPGKRRRLITTLSMSVAAAMILVVVVIGLWSLPQAGSDPVAAISNTQAMSTNNASAPTGTHALLTLIDMSSVRLDSLSAGKIVVQNNSQVIKQDNGSIAYIPSPGSNKEDLQYNTLTVPSGGQVCLILPDQTRVWLNNMSSLRYPVAFKGSSREVFLKGEAYFEVSKDPLKPFLVQAAGMSNNMNITVLGTHFSVSAYNNEKEMKATLLEGKILVNSASGAQMLSPGEQVIITGKEKQLVKEVDAADVTAWKEGYFHFTHADINAVLRQLCRWYGMEQDNRAPDIVHIYDGEINRSLPISEVLKNLENDDVHFRAEGKKIIVTR